MERGQPQSLRFIGRGSGVVPGGRPSSWLSFVTAPRTGWRVMRAPAAETGGASPVRDRDWVTHRAQAGERDTA
jgi:hypothetical protein